MIAATAFDVREFTVGFTVAAGWLCVIPVGQEDAWREHLEAVGVDYRDGVAAGSAAVELLDDTDLGLLVQDAYRFVSENAADLDAAVAAGRPEADLGMDLLLSRCRHGTGFWDRGLGLVGDRLHAAATLYGDVMVDVFRQPDGWHAVVL
jgi:hypothetical protein